MSLSVLLLASPELWVAKVALGPRSRKLTRNVVINKTSREIVGVENLNLDLDRR